MAAGDIILSDGFDSLSFIGWNSEYSCSISSSYSRVTNSGAGLHFTSTNNGFNPSPELESDTFAPIEEFLLSFAFKIGLVTSNLWLVTFKDGTETSNHQCALVVNSSAHIAFVRRNSGNPTYGIAATLAEGSTILQANRWYWVEAKIRVSSTNGYVELKLDGNTEISMTTSLDSSNTANDYATRINLNSSFSSSNTTIDYDDVVLFDNTGNTMSFLGDVRILDLVPTADGNSSDWTPSTGVDNYAMIDELPPVDTDYVYTNTVGHKDTYVFQDLPASATTVYGITYVTRSFKTDAGTRTLRNVMRQASTDYERSDSDTSISLSPSTAFYSETVNPATAVAYTVSDINGNEFGFKLQA